MGMKKVIGSALVGLVSVLMLALGSVSASASPHAPAGPTGNPEVLVTCYGGSVAITLPPNGYSGEYTTSSRCRDINLRIDSGGGQWVAVCWAAHNSCQDHWTWVPQDGSYHVVATDVLDGTRFYFTTTGGGGNRYGRTAY